VNELSKEEKYPSSFISFDVIKSKKARVDGCFFISKKGELIFT